MRVTWNGSLSFGLVSIPVGLAPATKPAARQSDVSFRMLHRECLTPIKQKRWCPTHDRELAPDEIVKGWEVAKGQFVIVEEAELEALERHDDSRTIDIERFVPLDDVDPIWMDRTYFLVPGAAPAQRRPYKLLLEAMEESSVGAIGRLVRSGRESLCLVRPRGQGLVLETLYLVEDVYSQAEIDEAMEETDLKAQELDLARQIVEGLQADFDPSELTSGYRPRPARAPRGQAQGRADRRSRARGRAGAHRRPHRGAQGERRRGQDLERRPEGGRRQAGPTASRLGSRLRRSARTNDEGPGTAGPLGLRKPLARRGRWAAPAACSCAWKRCLSILPW